MLKPTRGKYYCKLLKDDKITDGGIILPENVKEAPKKGLVIAVGCAKLNDKGKTILPSAREGDIVHFKRIWHRERVENGEEYIFVKEEEIIGIERKEK